MFYKNPKLGYMCLLYLSYLFQSSIPDVGGGGMETLSVDVISALSL